MSAMDKDLKNKTFGELEEIVEDFGCKKYLAGYIFTFIHLKNVTDIPDISPLSKAFRNNLIEQGYYISQLNTVKTVTDPDGTIKYLFESADSSRFEAVLLMTGVKHFASQLRTAARWVVCFVRPPGLSFAET
jgi:23S rRNA (adenine2503-C2)-methyltransferase